MGGGGAAGRRCVRLVGGQWALYVAELTLARAGGGEDKKSAKPWASATSDARARPTTDRRPTQGDNQGPAETVDLTRIGTGPTPTLTARQGTQARAIGVWEVGGELRHLSTDK